MKRIVTLASVSIIVLGLILTGQTFAEINPEDLAGLWLFDEGKGDVAKDSSGNGNDAQVPGSVKWIKGKFGNGLEFDGTPNYVTVPHNDMFNFGADDFSMGCWMDAKRKDAYVMIKRVGGTFWAMSASIDRDTGVFIFEGGGVHIDTGKTVIVNKGWRHCVVVRKDGVVSLYVDGEFETQANIPANMDDITAPIQMGGWGSENHDGGLDEVFIFKAGVALTEEDIKTIFENGWEKAFAVSPVGKLATIWSAIKTQ